MSADFQYDVFLSHNSQDKPKVRRLAERLRAANLRVWLDEWVIKPGDDIYLAIERGLETSRTLVLCLSPAALGSDWVKQERSTVLFRDPTNAGRRFIPLLLENCNLPDALRRYKYVDFRQEADAAFDELLSCCRPEDTTSFVAFSYPDIGDRVTAATIRALEPRPGYWSESEGRMRKDFLGEALRSLPRGGGLRGVDAGCGHGRLLSWLLDDYCRQVTALEPDPARLQVAKDRLDPDKQARVEFVAQSIEEFAPTAPYDLVLCSHVLQHVTRAGLAAILARLRSLCAAEGRVVLFTAHAAADPDRYVKAHLAGDGSHREDPITPGEFDALVGNREGVLPIRFFSLKTLERALRDAGLNLQAHHVYHCCENVFGDLEQFCFRDTIVNRVPELQRRLGRDLALVAAPV